MHQEQGSHVTHAPVVMPPDAPSEPLPFWLVNVLRDEWPAECPDFLSGLSEKDERIIGTPDSEYHRMTWPEVQRAVGA